MTPQVLVIGGGPAGMTAALYAARARMRPLVIAGYACGGQLMQTTEVENFPGFAQGILGPDLMSNMRAQAERFGARILEEDALDVRFNTPAGHTVTTDGGTWSAPSVIVATGASALMLGVPGEDAWLGRGVATCAVCDGAHFAGRKVAVVGGGDSALEEVLQLSRLAREVHLLHRRDHLRASRIMQEKALSLPNVRIIWNSEVTEVLGDRRMTALRVRDTQTRQERTEPYDGLFVAIGHAPNTTIFRGLLPMDDKGYLKTIDGETRTEIPGVFVAGDVFDFKYRQAITAAASGCKAALEAERFVTLGGMEVVSAEAALLH